MQIKGFNQELLDIISETEAEIKIKAEAVKESEKIKTFSEEFGTDNSYAAPFESYAAENYNGLDIEKNDGIGNENDEIKQKPKQEIYSDMHKGRRERVRFSVDKDLEFETFADHEVLEYLLFDTISRIDTNPYAHELVDHFGSLWGVLNANPNELTKFSYISAKTARRLRDYIPVARRAELSRLKNNEFLDTTLRAAEYLRSHFSYRNKETLYAMCLDVNDRLLSVCRISEGDTSLVPVSVKRIAEAAFSSGASKIILAHNHPAETLAPSKDDIETTKRICIALLSMNILLVDHLIFTSDNFYSFFMNELMDDVYRNCDKAIGSEVCRQMRQRKKIAPENYVLEKDVRFTNFNIPQNESQIKYIRFKMGELFPKK